METVADVDAKYGRRVEEYVTGSRPGFDVRAAISSRRSSSRYPRAVHGRGRSSRRCDG